MCIGRTQSQSFTKILTNIGKLGYTKHSKCQHIRLVQTLSGIYLKGEPLSSLIKLRQVKYICYCDDNGC